MKNEEWGWKKTTKGKYWNNYGTVLMQIWELTKKPQVLIT